MVKSSTHALDDIFHALSDRTRRSILTDIARGERTVGRLAKPYRMSLAAVSKHLNVLEAAHLVGRKRVGRFQVVSLRVEPLRVANDWIAAYEKFWGERLDALQDLLEKHAT